MSNNSRRATDDLIARRAAVLGRHSPTFYDVPLHIISAHGVRLVAADGTTYLDAYNNVQQVGHGNPVVVRAITEQAAVLNVHTRYLHDPVVDYAEMLLATFSPHLDKVSLTNSGSEANELAVRMARQHTGSTGMLVSDFNYHGNTISLSEMAAGAPIHEPLGSYVRALSIPDTIGDDRPEHVIAAEALAHAARAIASLVEDGHGVAALLIDSIFANEGLVHPPAGYVASLAALVRQAGGLVIADEVQSGMGRVGSHFWGHEAHGIEPDVVTLGKPLGNGHPMGAVVTTADLLEEFGSRNYYFNTFGGNPVSAAAGMAVLRETADRDLQGQAAVLGAVAREQLAVLSRDRNDVFRVRGKGLFVGIELVDDDSGVGGARAAWVVEDMLRRGILISRIGPRRNVLKIRPPMVFDRENMDEVVENLMASVVDSVDRAGAS